MVEERREWMRLGCPRYIEGNKTKRHGRDDAMSSQKRDKEPMTNHK